MRASWKALTGLFLITIVVMGLLYMLSVFKFRTTLTHLVQNRLGVIAEGVADSLEGAVDLGLSLSELGTAPELIERTKANDGGIEIIDICDTSGFILFSTGSGRAGNFLDEDLRERLLHDSGRTFELSVEKAFLNGIFLTDSIGRRIGGVLITYSRSEFAAKVGKLHRSLMTNIALVGLPSLGIAFFGIRIGFRDLDLYSARVDRVMKELLAGDSDTASEPREEATGDGLPDPEVLERKLRRAAGNLARARTDMDVLDKSLTNLGEEGR